MAEKFKIGVLLSGSGVYDGSEIHESVLTLLAIDDLGHEAFCMAPNIQQYHVVNHLDGSEMDEVRNVLVESARIARGNIQPLESVKSDDFDALAILGGFGAAKNLTKWAFEGEQGEINEEVKRIIQESVANGKPIAAMCMGPTVLAKALEGKEIGEKLTVGTSSESSPYDIADIHSRMRSIGAETVDVGVTDVLVDANNKMVTTPCYMMDAGIASVNKGIRKAVEELVNLL